MAQQQGVAVTILPVNKEFNGYSSGLALNLGITQIVFGSLTIIFTIITIVLFTPTSIVGTGIWSGIFFIIAGILGILSKKSNRVTCHIIAFMVLSIIAAISAMILLITSIISIIIFNNRRVDSEYFRNIFSPIGFVFDILLLLISVFETIVAIISSSLCCRASCGCCNLNQSQQPYYYASQTQYIHSPSGGQQVQLFSHPVQGCIDNNMPRGGFNVQTVPNIQQQSHGTAFPQYSMQQSHGTAFPQYSAQTVPDIQQSHGTAVPQYTDIPSTHIEQEVVQNQNSKKNQFGYEPLLN